LSEQVENAALTDKELAALIGVTRRCIQQWRKRGLAPASIKVGNVRRTPRSSFIRWAVAHGRLVPMPDAPVPFGQVYAVRNEPQE
jgi:hypothetical protein